MGRVDENVKRRVTEMTRAVLPGVQDSAIGHILVILWKSLAKRERKTGFWKRSVEGNYCFIH